MLLCVVFYVVLCDVVCVVFDCLLLYVVVWLCVVCWWGVVEWVWW